LREAFFSKGDWNFLSHGSFGILRLLAIQYQDNKANLVTGSEALFGSQEHLVGSISDKMGIELCGTGVFWHSKIICHPVARETDELSQT
jgi:hypothetical protein